MARRLRIGIVGAGLIGRRHIATVVASPEAELCGVADTLPRSDPAVAALPCDYFASHRELLAAAKPDAVIIATPNRLHVPMGIDCARAGVPMIVEKPIADTIDDACALLREAKRASVALLVGHHRRYHAQAAEARRIVAGGQLGTLVAASVLWATRKPDAYFDAAWRTAAGGGPILINLIHEIDMLRFLGGELASVSGLTSNALRGFAVEDSAAVMFRFVDGALGTILCTDAAVSPWTIEQGLGENPAFRFTGENVYRLMGTRGALDFPNLRVWTSRDPAKVGWDQPLAVEPVKTLDRDPYLEQVRHLRAVIEGRESPVVSGVDGARTLAATLAVHESARTGAPVDLARDYALIAAAAA
ncbi:MAG TPA: Gfo/Idh/MocA family oxidoreductase [Casimicrobiaceae bacterium]|jgi:predicted dehydrogenase|nr:Gfo/Idh/MocA family oxidoreductase [Casimicrobiaceae bacterium]